MGWNTLVLFLNDAIRGLKDKDNNFSDDLYYAILRKCTTKEPVELSLHGYANGATVVYSDHADSLSLIMVGTNTAEVLGNVMWRRDEPTDSRAIRLLKEVADKYGYQLRKKPKVKK